MSMLKWVKSKIAQAVGTASLQFYGGTGTLHCNACGHSEHVHLFTHGFGPESSCTMGYQCQCCAKFVTFDSEPVGESGLIALRDKVSNERCECGGKYARDKPMMCPRCKSVRVVYDLGLIT